MFKRLLLVTLFFPVIVNAGEVIFENGFEKPHLVINEVDYNQAGPDNDEFIEIYNPADTVTSLANISVFLINNAGVDYIRYDLDALGSLQAGQYLVIGSANAIANTALGALTLLQTGLIQNGSNDGMVLFDRSKQTVIDGLSYDGDIISATLTGFGTVPVTEFSSAPADSATLIGSISRLPNGKDSNDNSVDFIFTDSVTPGSGNFVLMPPDLLVINEFDYDQSGLDTIEFVEIHNPTDFSIDLDGVFLFFIDGGTNTEYDQFDLGLHGILQPHGYIVIGSAIVISSSPQGVFTQQINSTIRNGPDGFVLIDTFSNTAIDGVSYEGNIVAATITNVGIIAITEGTSSLNDPGEGSFARSPNGMDTDNNDNDFILSNNITPGRDNDATGGLVINEIDYDQPGLDDGEFIEIYNSSSASIPLVNVTLYLINGGGPNAYEQYDLSSLGNLMSGQYLVIGDSTALANTALGALTLPQTGTIQNSTEGVILLNSLSNTVIDSMSYEGNILPVILPSPDLGVTVNVTEGTSSLVDIGAGSLSRIPNGQDTNNNDADYIFTVSVTPGFENNN